VNRRGRRSLVERLEARPRLVGVAAVLIVIGAWSFCTRPGSRLAGVVAPPGDLVVELVKVARDGYMGTSLWSHFQASLLRTMTGFVAGSAAGIVLGLLMGYSRIAAAALMPFFSFVRPIPAIAYIPMVILWFGIGEFSKILVIFLASFLYVSMNTAAGVQAVPQELLRVARTFGANATQLFFLVILPEALPYVILGLKVGLALSWAVVVASELVAAQSGLGYMIMDAGTFFRINDVYIGVFLIGLVGLLLERVLVLMERRVVHWSGKT
jgi:ABC-type nitrate/sulfonate/bicarbonate transport system permease component